MTSEAYEMRIVQLPPSRSVPAHRLYAQAQSRRRISMHVCLPHSLGELGLGRAIFRLLLKLTCASRRRATGRNEPALGSSPRPQRPKDRRRR